MKKILSLVLSLSMLAVVFAACGGTTSSSSEAAPVEPASTVEPTGADEPEETPEEPAAGGYSAGMVILGLGSEFFQALADTFVVDFTAAGWEATVANGEFDPAVQIEAIENFTAMGVDVLYIFPSDGQPVDDALGQAQAAGIKVIEMVNTGDNWDVAMLSDDNIMAESVNLLAAAWVEKTFADAEDESVDTVVLTYYASEANRNQSEVNLRIGEYSSKINVVGEYQLAGETTEDGMSAAENILTQYPNVKLILGPNGTAMAGVNNYLTSMNSPISDYSEIGLFTANGSGDEVYDAIRASATNESPFRGSVITGGVQTTIDEVLEIATGLMDGSITKETRYSKYELVIGTTIDEYLNEGTVDSYTTEDAMAEVGVYFFS